MGKSPEDNGIMKLVRAEIAKRLIDTTMADVRVQHGVITIRGVVRALKEGPEDVKAELELIGRILRQRPGVKDVVIDCAYR